MIPEPCAHCPALAVVRCHDCYRAACAPCALETRCPCGRSWSATILDEWAEEMALEAYRDEMTMRALGWGLADTAEGPGKDG